jgi:glyoxylate reductase
MRVIYNHRRPNKEMDDLGGAGGARRVPLEELLREADFISLHVPLSDATRHLIGRKELALMKPTAVLINTARGPVVDEEALVEALREKRLFAAGLDVYEREPALHPGLFELENVVLLPHIGSATVSTRNRMAQMAAENLIAMLAGRKPATPVNPELWDDGRHS